MHKNGLITLQQCTSEFIVMIDGDDYWTSVFKLQKQINYLGSNPDCCICFHNVREIYEDGSRVSHPYHQHLKEMSELIFDIGDIVTQNFIPTPSIMFRNHLIPFIPEWFFGLPMGDWPLLIMNALHGKIGFINEEMAVHLNHDGGVWYKMVKNKLKTKEASKIVYDALSQALNKKYQSKISNSCNNLYLQLATEHVSSGEFQLVKECAIDAICKATQINIKTINMAMRLLWPERR